ncbi:MAG: 16S rRNA (cytosine(967)-C(5))-methyltransferase RsmB [Thermodesulfobacteriota bacterium]
MKKNNASGPDDARGMAVMILNLLSSSRTTLDQAVEEYLTRDRMPSHRERSLAMAILYGVMRWRARLDHMIRHFSATPLNKIDPEILNILRISLFQLLYLDRVPTSAAVNTAVELTKKYGRPYITRYVNGVLRNAARSFQTVPFPSIEEDPIQALAAEYAFPAWLMERWLHRFGMDQTRKLCEAVNTIPPITIRVNPLKTSRETVYGTLSPAVESISPTPYSPEGLQLSGPSTAIPDFQEFKDGLFQVQDEASQLVAYLLAPRPDETVLDACAGLGGKTANIAQMMNNRGRLVAMDLSSAKLNRLATEMNRMGISMVYPAAQDILLEFGPEVLCQYDRVLLDAPCSGLGVLRRNPDGKWSDAKKKLLRFQRNQLALINRLAALVKPGGILVYSVCSFEPEENELLIETFLNHHPQFFLEKPPETFPNTALGLIDSRGFLKTYPHLHHTDGFFGARLRRKTSS